jgi:hypothetical protein
LGGRSRFHVDATLHHFGGPGHCRTFVFWFWRAVSKINPDFDLGNFEWKTYIWDRPFHRTGDKDLPHSVRLKGTAYRWQDPERVRHGERFYEMFEDGPWKWDASGRFAALALTTVTILV